MKAVLIDKVTKGAEVCLSEIPVPETKPGWVLVKIKAFGVNHSEQVLREEEILEDYIQKPIVPGIECVGEIADPSDSGFCTGQRVCALMGGMGRSFHGSYAQYALLPVKHVFAIETSLDWIDMAAVPESYFTAWGSLFECLRLCKEDTLLIRGASCALGYVTIQIAKAFGCKVIATTHRETYRQELLRRGADEVLFDPDYQIAGKVTAVTKLLELVGAKSVRDSLRAVEPGGIVCHTGILGGEYVLDGFDPIKEIPNGVYLTGFFSNYPTQQVMQQIFSFLDEHGLKPLLGEVRKFSDITKAMDDFDNHRIRGKLVIDVDI